MVPLSDCLYGAALFPEWVCYSGRHRHNLGYRCAVKGAGLIHFWYPSQWRPHLAYACLDRMASAGIHPGILTEWIFFSIALQQLSKAVGLHSTFKSLQHSRWFAPVIWRIALHSANCLIMCKVHPVFYKQLCLLRICGGKLFYTISKWTQVLNQVKIRVVHRFNHVQLNLA